MNINNIYGTATGLSQQVNQNGQVNKPNKKAVASSKVNDDTVVNLSPEAKKLQETSQVLKSALAKLDEHEAFRDEKLNEVQTKIDDGFYDSAAFDGKLAEKIYSDDKLKSLIEETRQTEKYAQRLKEMPENETTEAKIDYYRQRVNSDYYNQSDKIDKTAEHIVDLLF